MSSTDSSEAAHAGDPDPQQDLQRPPAADEGKQDKGEKRAEGRGEEGEGGKSESKKTEKKSILVSSAEELKALIVLLGGPLTIILFVLALWAIGSKMWVKNIVLDKIETPKALQDV